MSSQTKIIVLHQKKLLYTAIAIIAVVFISTLILICTSDKNAEQTAPKDYTYNAGCYSSTVILNGNPMEINVLIDENFIHQIEVTNISESIETMFPLFNTCLDDITNQVILNNSTQNITYLPENKYTSTVLLNAIDTAINKSIK